MTTFDGHLKCACCRDKSVGKDLYVVKKDCNICKAFTVEQKQQLATTTYKAQKEKEHSKKTASPTLVDPADCKLLGRVEGDRAVEETPANKKKKNSEDIPKASKKKASKPASDDLRSLDEKWSQRFASLEAMVLAKTFAVPVEPV